MQCSAAHNDKLNHGTLDLREPVSHQMTFIRSHQSSVLQCHGNGIFNLVGSQIS